MNIWLLFLITSVVSLMSKAFSKLCSNMVAQSSAAKYSLILIVNSLLACLFFWCSGGFSLSINAPTLGYSVVYALVVAVSLLLNLLVYRYASISGVNILSSGCAMLCSTAVGWLAFSEQIDERDLIRLSIMLAAVFLVFLDQKRRDRKEREEKKSNLICLFLMIAVMTLCSCASTVVLKLFTESDAVTDEISFFFLTNFVLLVGAAAVFGGACNFRRGAFRESIALLRPKRIISVVGNTVCSNISSVISVLIIAQMDLSVYSPISAAIGIVIGLLGSLMFRERLGVLSYVAAAVACVAVII